MPEDKPAIRMHHCSYGQMRWRIAAEAKGMHVVCHCGDCQTFANTLDRGSPRVDCGGRTEILRALPMTFES
jgi:hypothetical protein